jgi:hypothetical protein
MVWPWKRWITSHPLHFQIFQNGCERSEMECWLGVTPHTLVRWNCPFVLRFGVQLQSSVGQPTPEVRLCLKVKRVFLWKLRGLKMKVFQCSNIVYYITLFRSITMFFGVDIIQQNISQIHSECEEYFMKCC